MAAAKSRPSDAGVAHGASSLGSPFLGSADKAIAWRSSVEHALMEMETLVDGWFDLGMIGDNGGNRVSPLVWTARYHVERLRAAFDGEPS